jgi:hypothetical protein
VVFRRRATAGLSGDPDEGFVNLASKADQAQPVAVGRSGGVMMRHMSVFSAALAVLAATVCCSAARANALPAANGYVQCDTRSGFITSPTSCDGGTDNGVATYSPFASLYAYALGRGLTDVAGVFGVLNYSLEVTGGTPGDVVPLDIDTVLEALPISIGYAFSEIGVSADGSTGVTICTDLCGSGSGVTGFSGTLAVDAVSGTVYTNAIHLEIEVGGGLGTAADVDGGTASVDPFIYVAPTFPDAGDYTVLLSDGIGNGVGTPTGVPEPAAWAMMVLGVGLVGARRRIGRRWNGAAFSAA